MSFLNRWADKLEMKNVDRVSQEIAGGLQKMFPSADPGLPEIREYMLTRRGWTDELWNAYTEALEMTPKPESTRQQSLVMVALLSYVDLNYAQRDIGEKLSRSRRPLFETSMVAESIADGFADFLRRV